MHALKLIKSALEKGADHLGDLVWWSLSEARVPRITLEVIWNEAGLPPELLPEAPSAERAFKAAIKEAQVGQQGRLIRLAVETPAEVVFGVVREDRHGDGTLVYRQEARVTLDRNRDQLSSDAPGNDLVLDVMRRFEVLKTTHVADDLRRAITRTLDTFAAVMLRPSGGVYWAAAPYAAQVRQLQVAVQRIGTSTMSVLPVHRSPEAEQTLAQVARASIEDELAALQTEITAFVSTPPDRASTLLRRFDAFEALRARARLYRSVLNIQVQDLDQQLDGMSAAVEGLLNQKAA
ncbi:MAG: DUF6744 family protein [Rhodoglobus sp.]